MSEAYESLKARMQERANLRRIVELLAYDRDTIMPKDGDKHRNAMIAQAEVEFQRKGTDDAVGKWLEQAAQDNLTDEADRRNLLLIRERYVIDKVLPEKLTLDLSNATSETTTAYEHAKASSDWNAVKAPLEKLVALAVEQGKIVGDALECAPYDALIGYYSRGTTAAQIDPLFADLRKELVPLIGTIRKKQENKKADFDFTADTTPEIKAAFFRQMAKATGYDFNRGLIGETIHPFSSGSKYDARITTFRNGTISTNLFSILHEAGHARYAQNLPEEWDGQPVGDAMHMGLHESQSLAVEKQMGYSKEFLAYAYDTMVFMAPEMEKAGDVESFINSFHKVQPSFIRFEADEATYPLHVMLRYGIERQLFDGTLKVADIPTAWNEQFEKDFGMKVPAHNKGCMQDVHWYCGLFGYFPSYTEGALYAAQLYAAAKRDITNTPELLRDGNMVPIVDWMGEKVHKYGQLYDAADLITRATGEKPTSRYFIDHLKARYLA